MSCNALFLPDIYIKKGESIPKINISTVYQNALPKYTGLASSPLRIRSVPQNHIPKVWAKTPKQIEKYKIKKVKETKKNR